MSLFHYPIVTTLLSTVDRIEEEYAVLEWDNLALSAIHSSVFPFPLREGMRVEFTIYPSPIGRSYASQSDPCILLATHPIVIPIPNLVIPGLHYNYHIVEKPWIHEK